MNRYVVVAAALLGLAVAPAHAQEEEFAPCGTGGMTWTGLDALPTSVQPTVQEQLTAACVPLAGFMNGLQPAMGMSFSGGNPMLGSATTIGTRFGLFPRVSLTVRANMATMQDDAGVVSGLVSDVIGDLPVPVPGGAFAGAQADLSIGLFNGLPFGIGSVDLLGSFGYMPLSKMDLSGLGMELADIMSYGAGARVGILRQGILMPGLSVSGMYRKTQGFDFAGEIGVSDGMAASIGLGSELTNYSARAILSKGLLFIDLAVGAGYDQYEATYDIDLATSQTINGTTYDFEGTLVDAPHSSAAWNAFANVGLQVFILNIVAEAGFQKPMNPLTLEELQDPAATVGDTEVPADAGSLLKGANYFGSIGLRLQI